MADTEYEVEDGLFPDDPHTRTRNWRNCAIALIGLVLLLAGLAFLFALLAWLREQKIKNNIIDKLEERIEEVKNCSCRCRNITQAMIGNTSLILTENGCYVLTEDIVYDGSGTFAIILARYVSAEIDGGGYAMNLTQLISGAISVSEFGNIYLHDMVINKPENSRGTAIRINSNATSIVERVVTHGSGVNLFGRARSNTVVRDVLFDSRFDSAEMYDTWGFGFDYAAQSMVFVNDAMFLVDGAVLRCLDRRNELQRPPDFFNDWLCIGIYVGLSSSEPTPDVGNVTHGVLLNIDISGASSALHAPYFDSLVIDEVSVTCADGQFDPCVQIGCDTASGALRVGTITIDSRALRPESYEFEGGNAFWLVPLEISGALDVEIDHLNVVGRGGIFYDPYGFFFGPLVRRFPLVLIDTAPFCAPSVLGCENDEGKTVKIRNAVITATDDDTVGIIVGMGSGEGGPVQADLENVEVNGGAIGILIGEYAKTTRLHNVKITDSYYGLIITNYASGVQARQLVIQHTCIPYWVQENAYANMMQDVMCTLNVNDGINDNAANNWIEDGSPPLADITVYNLFLSGECPEEPFFFEEENDWAPYNEFVGTLSVPENNTIVNTSGRVPGSLNIQSELMAD